MAISSSRTNLYVFTVGTVTVRWCDLLTIVITFVYQLAPEVWWSLGDYTVEREQKWNDVSYLMTFVVV